jgi:TRAP-type mannitol/chloroaromatic compound transport system permease large subunit
LIVLPVFAPILQGIDFGPHIGDGGPIVFLTWFVVMLSVNLQTSFLTPPFGFALFYLRGVAPESVSTRDIYAGVLPFVAMQLLLLVVMWWWPNLVLWLPEAMGR